MNSGISHVGAPIHGPTVLVLQVKRPSSQTKGCGPQPLMTAGEPSHSWSGEQLGDYARAQHAIIINGEKLLTPAYWRLGQALCLARKRLNRGQWGSYLVSLGIEKTRASKARAIFRAFRHPEEAKDLSVEEAYECRQRRLPRRQKSADPESSAFQAECTCQCGLDELERLVNQLLSAPPPLCQAAVIRVTAAIHRLEHVKQQLQDQLRSETGPL